ncbi:MAG: RNA methyltransferase [Clostridia bacterium]|nr:RNA methyltransferase [Clostridia bacterium]
MIIQNEIITSRQNPAVKWAASLQSKKGREESGCFLAEGEKLAREAASARLPVTHIFISEKRRAQLEGELLSLFSENIYDKTRLYVVSEECFCKISSEIAPQGVITVIKYLDFFKNKDIIYKEDFFLAPNERALALFSIRDPGNLGSVIRSAVAFGIEHLVLSGDCVDIYNPKAVRSAMGSLFKIKVTVVGDFISFIRSARALGRAVYSAELSERARALGTVALKRDSIVIIGNEGHGVSEEVSLACDAGLYIPISEKTESLNASVAAGILMWEQSKTD